MSIGIKISVDRTRYGGLNPDAITHANRVIADGGVLPLGVDGVNYVFNQLQLAIGSSYLSISATCYDAQYLGYKQGTGSGVTLGQATQKLYAIGGSSYDLVQATVSAQPLLLAWNSIDTNYYFNPCVASNSVTSGTAISWTSLTDTLIITAKIFANNQTTTSWDNIVVQNTLFGLQIQNNGTQKRFRINATTAATGSTLYTPSTTAPHFIRATITPSNITYAWSEDGSTYTTLDTGITLPTIGTTGTLTIGGSANSTANVCNVYSVVLNNSTTSSTITFDPNSYVAATSQTTWTGGGATWTINTGTTTTGYKGILVDRTIVQADGVDDWISNSTVLRGDICTQYLSLKYYHTPSAGVAMVGAYDLASYNSIALLSATVIRCYQENGANVLNKTITYGTLNLVSLINKGGANSLQINNGTAETNSQNPSTSKTGLVLFRNAFNGGIQAGFITTYFCILIENTAGERTAIYTLLKTMNKNAF